MIVVGGTYDEICFEPRWEEKFGSGLRACRVINSLNSNIELEFYTFADITTKLYLDQIKKVFPTITSIATAIEKTMLFYYDHPLISPRISPRLDTIKFNENKIFVEGSDALCFGMIEGEFEIHAKRVVYDPQSPSNPKLFSEINSTATVLSIVCNLSEAIKMAKTTDMPSIINFFIEKEKVDNLILKIGPRGALVVDKDSKTEQLVPVYKSSNVWPIGSGDIFASSYAYHWFNGETSYEAAQKASLLTAFYSNTKSLDFKQDSREFDRLLITHEPTSSLYLAGPFFTYTQRWLIDQIRYCFRHMSINVFSPWHDIGHGIASDVVPKDLEGLEKSKLVFAVIDGLDSGTLFEVGYAVKKGITVIAYVQNESEESVKMLEGTGCILEKDLATAIYKTYWLLTEHE